MSPKNSGAAVAGHTDLPDSPETINSAHLVEMATRSVGRSEVLCELALAWTAVTRPYVAGTRGLARWAGMSDKTVREVVGANGGKSRHGLLWTQTRGSASPIPEDRESMEVWYSSNTRTDYRSTSKKISTSPSLSILKKEGGGKTIKGNAVVSARISSRAQEALDQGVKTLSTLTELKPTTELGYVLTVLDPGLDLWAEIEGDTPENAAVQPLGRRAWALAVLCGLENVVLSTEDVAGLLGLSKRGAQDLLARLRAINPLLVWRVRQGRSIVYEIKWASNYRMSGDWWETCWTDDRIRKARASKDLAVQAISARRGTPAGFLAYRLSTANPKREEYRAANPLPADADPVWVALVEEGDELKLHEHLLAKESEAGSVPSTPAALDGPAEPKPAEERRQVLAAVRQRIADAQVKANLIVIEQPVPRAERQADETEDDFVLRTFCMGRADIFKNVHGRLPNQPMPEPTERQLRRRRARQADGDRRWERVAL